MTGTTCSLKRCVVRPVRAEIELDDDCALVSGKQRQEVGQQSDVLLVREHFENAGGQRPS